MAEDDVDVEKTPTKDVHDLELPSTVVEKVEVPFSIFTSREKWALIAMAALAGFFS